MHRRQCSHHTAAAPAASGSGSPATRSTYCSPNESIVRRHAQTLFGFAGRSKTTRSRSERSESTDSSRSSRRVETNGVSACARGTSEVVVVVASCHDENAT